LTCLRFLPPSGSDDRTFDVDCLLEESGSGDGLFPSSRFCFGGFPFLMALNCLVLGMRGGHYYSVGTAFGFRVDSIRESTFHHVCVSLNNSSIDFV
jgi:hypothetical protein